MSYINKDATLTAIANKAKAELADVNHYFLEGVQLAVDVVEGMPEVQPSSSCVHENDTISRQAAIDLLKQMRKDGDMVPWEGKDVFARIRKLPSAQPEHQWIPCSEKLPEINQTVLLSTTDGEVIVGYRYKPDIVWQVTANDGRKIWVYDPENYSGNIDELPKAETCGFENRDNCWLSVTSINYDKKFAGISAWMPLPEPPKEVDHETD